MEQKVEEFKIMSQKWKDSDGDHYPTFGRDSKSEAYIVGSNAALINQDGEIYERSGFKDVDGLYIIIDGKETSLDASKIFDFEELHRLMMYYTYAYKKLSKMSSNKALNSKYYKIKVDIENYLKGDAEFTHKNLSKEAKEAIVNYNKKLAKIYAVCLKAKGSNIRDQIFKNSKSELKDRYAIYRQPIKLTKEQREENFVNYVQVLKDLNLLNQKTLNSAKSMTPDKFLKFMTKEIENQTKREYVQNMKKIKATHKKFKRTSLKEQKQLKAQKQKDAVNELNF